jgi:hypothetical protein
MAARSAKNKTDNSESGVIWGAIPEFAYKGTEEKPRRPARISGTTSSCANANSIEHAPFLRSCWSLNWSRNSMVLEKPKVHERVQNIQPPDPTVSIYTA